MDIYNYSISTSSHSPTNQLVAEAWTLDSTRTNLVFFRNGIVTASASLGVVPAPISQGLSIGNRCLSDGLNKDTGFGWQGDIAEILVYDHQLSASEMAQVNTYLSGHYFLGSAPTISPAGGTNTPSATPITISINGAAANQQIYYTLDGSTPTASSLHYTAPFSISSNATVTAALFSLGNQIGPAASNSYVCLASWLQQYFGTNSIDITSNAPSGDGYTLLQDFQLGRDPLDYYQGSAPVISFINGANQVTGTGGTFSTISVLVNGGATNAPVTLTVQSGQALLSALGSSSKTTSLQLRTTGSFNLAGNVYSVAQASVYAPSSVDTSILAASATAGSGANQNNTTITTRMFTVQNNPGLVPPTNLTATPTSSSSVNLTWTPSDPTQAVTIYESIDSNTWSAIPLAGSTSSTDDPSAPIMTAGPAGQATISNLHSDYPLIFKATTGDATTGSTGSSASTPTPSVDPVGTPILFAQLVGGEAQYITNGSTVSGNYKTYNSELSPTSGTNATFGASKQTVMNWVSSASSWPKNYYQLSKMPSGYENITNAYYDLSPDANGNPLEYGLQKMRYQFQVNATPGEVTTWVEVFYPNYWDSSDLKGNSDGSTYTGTPQYHVISWTNSATAPVTNTPIHTNDPSTNTTPGRYEVVPLQVTLTNLADPYQGSPTIGNPPHNGKDTAISLSTNSALSTDLRSIAWIAAEDRNNNNAPRMPQLVASAGNIAGLTYCWKLSVIFHDRFGNPHRDFDTDDPNCSNASPYLLVNPMINTTYTSNTPDQVTIPLATASADSNVVDGWLQITNGTPWNIYQDTDWINAVAQGFFGGDAVLSLKILDSNGNTIGRQQNYNFRIAGENPDPVKCSQYINSVSGNYWYLYAIAKQETDGEGGGAHYNHFLNNGGEASAVTGHEGVPNWHDDGVPGGFNKNGIPNRQTGTGGYGLLQLTYQASNGVGDTGDTNYIIPRDWIWNWRNNVQPAVTKLQQKKTSATSLYNWLVANFGTSIQSEHCPTSGNNEYVFNAYNGILIAMYNGNDGFTTVLAPDKKSSRFSPWKYENGKWIFTGTYTINVAGKL